MRMLIPFSAMSLLILLVACHPAEPLPEGVTSLPQPQITTIAASPTAMLTAVPAIPTDVPPDPFPFYLGTEIKQLSDIEWSQSVVESGVQLIRHNGVLWSEVEPEPGERRWEVLADIEPSLAYLGNNGVQTIMIVRSAPPFAQREQGVYCGPIATDAFPAFAAFLGELVARYSQPPYNIHYWELGNEPDIAFDGIRPREVFGCWGDPEVEDFGGSYYAEMLKWAYPAIKSADPEAQVLIGGLLLDCDPDYPLEGRSCVESNFLEGILRAGGGDYFDAISFHAYSFFNHTGVFEDTIPNWEIRGGVLLGKIHFLKQVLGEYNLEKPLYLTEAALTCPEWSGRCNPLDEMFYMVQAQYVPRVYIRSWANGIEGTIWYQFDGIGWRQSGLAGPITEPKPSLAAFQYLSQRLADALFIRTVLEDSRFLVYEFQAGSSLIHTVWTPDWEVRSYQLPPGVLEVHDIFGQQVPIQDGEVLVDGVLYLTLPASE